MNEPTKFSGGYVRGSLREDLARCDAELEKMRQSREPTPYERGEADGLAGKPPPRHFPTPDSSWEERLYHRGWEAGNNRRCDCQNPDGPEGVRHISMECPVHNENPWPRSEA